MIVQNGTVAYRLQHGEVQTDEQGRPLPMTEEWSEPIAANVQMMQQDRQYKLQDGTVHTAKFCLLVEEPFPFDAAVVRVAINCNDFGIRKVLSVEPLTAFGYSKIVAA